MEIITIKFHHKDAIFEKAHSTDTGYDVKCVGYEVKSDRRVMLDLGISLQPPTGHYFELSPRSSIFKTEFMQQNSVGIIDEDYRGNVKMPLLLWSTGICSKEVLGQLVKKYFMSGKACAQIVLKKKIQSIVVVVDTLSETTRGDGGFGSTDDKS